MLIAQWVDRPVEIIKEVIKEVDRPVVQYVDRPYEVIKEVPVTQIVEKEIIKEVIKEVPDTYT